MRRRRRTAVIIASVTVAAGIAVAALLTASPASSDPGPAAIGVRAGVPVYLDHVGTGTQIKPDWGGMAENNQLQSHDATVNTNQLNLYRWRLTGVSRVNGEVAFQIRNLASNKCLTAPGDYRENTRVVQRTCNANAWSQRWLARGWDTGIEGSFVLVQAYSPELALTPRADTGLVLKYTGPYLNQLWRTRAIGGSPSARTIF